MKLIDWRLCSVRISVLMSAALFFVGCSLLYPPPRNVMPGVRFNEGSVEFFYWENIGKEVELKFDNYYFVGIRVSNSSCPGVRCDDVVWELFDVWRHESMYSLPSSILYGEETPGMDIVVPPKALEVNVPYAVVIGVVGINENGRRRNFSISSEFVIKVGESGDHVILSPLFESMK